MLDEMRADFAPHLSGCMLSCLLYREEERAVRLVCEDGLGVSKAADSLGVSQFTASAILQRAWRKLLEKPEEEGTGAREELLGLLETDPLALLQKANENMESSAEKVDEESAWWDGPPVTLLTIVDVFAAIPEHAHDALGVRVDDTSLSRTSLHRLWSVEHRILTTGDVLRYLPDELKKYGCGLGGAVLRDIATSFSFLGLKFPIGSLDDVILSEVKKAKAGLPSRVLWRAFQRRLLDICSAGPRRTPASLRRLTLGQAVQVGEPQLTSRLKLSIHTVDALKSELAKCGLSFGMRWHGDEQTGVTITRGGFGLTAASSVRRMFALRAALRRR